MKYNYKTPGILLLFFILSILKAEAQMSGVITINSSIPQSATNFTSFAALANTLNISGVNGPLLVNVTTSVYVEQVNFTQAAGVSPVNTITINGNNSTLTYNSTSTILRHTLLLSGADYMCFNNLTVTASGASNALSCHLWAGADNNRFDNCVFNAPLSGTSAFLCPFSISGTSVSATASGNSGNNNIVSTCTLSGGYYGAVFYGSITTPFNVNNQVINSKIVDFYANGFHSGYCQSCLLKGNIFERPSRTSVTSTEAIYLNTGTLNMLIEGNHIRRLFDGAGSFTTVYAYGIYNTAVATAGSENIIRNNIISDTRSNGIIYGVYLNSAPYSFVYHNTISIDDVAATSGAVRGIYSTGSSTNCRIRNNIITVTRGGSGAKYCLYYSPTATVALVSDNNVLYMNAAGGLNYVGSQTSDYANITSWQTGTGLDLNSISSNPLYFNPATMNYEPTSVPVNNLGVPVGVSNDFNNTSRSLLFPDPGAIEIFTTSCSGPPGPNSFVTPTFTFCPGVTVDLKLLNSSTYTNSGYTIAWQTSTGSIVGPFTAVPGATLNSYSTPTLNVTTYYRAVISCTNGGNYTTTSQAINVFPFTTSVVPYSESFESLGYNKLPNCQWSVSNAGGTTLTHTSQVNSLALAHTGSNFASFFNAPAGTNYFYSNGIHLNAGVTYSAGLWYITETIGFNKWTDLSILVGTSQTTTGAVMVASTNGPVSPQLYTLLSNTFTVLNSGLYYLTVRATSTTGVAPYLAWDDLSVTIPCQLNSSNVSIIASATNICAGQNVNLTALGSTNLFWSTGQTNSLITVSPPTPTTYSLISTDVSSGCTSTLTQYINVNPLPQVIAVPNTSVTCNGGTVSLNAFGASSYNWDNGLVGPSIVVTPSVTTSYTVTGISALGCSSTAIVQIFVNPIPPVLASISESLFCNGDEVMFTGSGALFYQWMLSSTSIRLGDTLVLSPSASGIYTLTGTDANGCEGTSTLIFDVEECIGLKELSASFPNTIRIYPNPTSGAFTAEFLNSVEKMEISDLTGRVICSYPVLDKKIKVDITTLANGIYYVRSTGRSSPEVIKLIKSTN